MIGHVSACMSCSFGLTEQCRLSGGAQLIGHRKVTVTDRWIPLVPAASGT
jgi:hypothetical protein